MAVAPRPPDRMHGKAGWLFTYFDLAFPVVR